MQTSKTIETLVIAVVMILAAYFLYQNFGEGLSLILANAAKAQNGLL